MKERNSFRIELDPNQEQQMRLAQYAEVARWVYNWGLDRSIEEHKSTNKIVSFDSLLNALSERENTDCQWLKDYSYYTIKRSLKNLNKDFRKACSYKGDGSRYPKHRAHVTGQGSFKVRRKITTTATEITLDDIGCLKAKGGIPANILHVYSVVVFQVDSIWYVRMSLLVDYNKNNHDEILETFVDGILQNATRSGDRVSQSS